MSINIQGIQNSLLSGKCGDDILSKLSDIHLEKLLARLANILSKIESAEELCKYCIWSKEKLKPNVVSGNAKENFSPKYKRFLQSAIRNLSQFCMPPSSTQMKNYKRKRKSVAEIAKPHNFNKVAYVKLCDIIHQKKYFMRAMNLVPSTVPVSEPTTENSPKFNENYKTLIPFSSEIGQKYMNNHKYHMTEYLLKRKQQYTDDHLNPNNQNTTETKCYEVTFSKNTECTHMYNFPKRKMQQNETYLKHLIATKCKPVSVSLNRLDLSGFGKKCVVSVERINISKYLNKKT